MRDDELCDRIVVVQDIPLRDSVFREPDLTEIAELDLVSFDGQDCFFLTRRQERTFVRFVCRSYLSLGGGGVVSDLFSVSRCTSLGSLSFRKPR